MLQCNHTGCSKRLKTKAGLQGHLRNGNLHENCPSSSCPACRQVGPLIRVEKPAKEYICSHSDCSQELSNASNRSRHQKMRHYCQKPCVLCDKYRTQEEVQTMLGKQIKLLFLRNYWALTKFGRCGSASIRFTNIQESPNRYSFGRTNKRPCY